MSKTTKKGKTSKLKRTRVMIGLVIISLMLLFAIVVVPRVTVAPGGALSISNRVLAQEEVQSIRRGGVPVISIEYIGGGLYINSSEPAYDIAFTKSQIDRWIKNKTTAEAEQVVRDFAQTNFEVWIKISDIEGIDASDPIMQDPPVLLDNERIAQRQGRDWLVTTLAYFDVHIYSLDPLKFITRINGVDAGPVTGDWWQ